MKPVDKTKRKVFNPGMSLEQAAQILGAKGGESTSTLKGDASRRNWNKAIESIKAKPKNHPEFECAICGSKFTVLPYRKNTAKTCSAQCRNVFNGRNNADKIGNAQRYKGEGKSYVKLRGRHMHRTIAEQKLGRLLKDGEIVHHIDGNKRNNHPDNLSVITQSEHIKTHLPEMRRIYNQKLGK